MEYTESKWVEDGLAGRDQGLGRERAAMAKRCDRLKSSKG